MFFPTLKLPLDSLSDEVRALFVVVQNGVHAVQRALWQAGWGLLEIDLFSAHPQNIDDITNCYKPYFRGYHLLPSYGFMISSIHQTGRRQMITRSKQNWEVGNAVKVGFLTLTVVAKVATPCNYLPDQYALTNNKGTFYCFIPHNGLTKCASLAEAMVPA